MLPCQVGRWPLKKRGERSEKRGKGLAREEVEIELPVQNMGAERGVTAALALFFFLLGGFFFLPAAADVLFPVVNVFNKTCSNRQARAVNWQLAVELQLDLASASPSSTASFHLPSSTSAQMQSKTAHNIHEIHTHAKRTHTVHAAASLRSPTAAFEPLQYLDNPSLPQPF